MYGDLGGRNDDARGLDPASVQHRRELYARLGDFERAARADLGTGPQVEDAKLEWPLRAPRTAIDIEDARDEETD
jgi:hypothetical protein